MQHTQAYANLRWSHTKWTTTTTHFLIRCPVFSHDCHQQLRNELLMPCGKRMPPLKRYLTSPGKTAAPQPCVLHQGTAETERQIVWEFCLIPISIKAAAAVYRKGGWGVEGGGGHSSSAFSPVVNVQNKVQKSERAKENAYFKWFITNNNNK